MRNLTQYEQLLLNTVLKKQPELIEDPLNNGYDVKEVVKMINDNGEILSNNNAVILMKAKKCNPTKYNELCKLGLLPYEIEDLINTFGGINNIPSPELIRNDNIVEYFEVHEPKIYSRISDTGVDKKHMKRIIEGINADTRRATLYIPTPNHCTSYHADPFTTFNNTGLPSFDTLSNHEITIRQSSLEDIFRERSIGLIISGIYDILNIHQIELNDCRVLLDIVHSEYYNNKISIIGSITSYMSADSPMFDSDILFELITPFVASVYNKLRLINIASLDDINKIAYLLDNLMVQVIDTLRYDAGEIYFPRGGLPKVMTSIK